VTKLANMVLTVTIGLSSSHKTTNKTTD